LKRSCDQSGDEEAWQLHEADKIQDAIIAHLVAHEVRSRFAGRKAEFSHRLTSSQLSTARWHLTQNASGTSRITFETSRRKTVRTIAFISLTYCVSAEAHGEQSLFPVVQCILKKNLIVFLHESTKYGVRPSCAAGSSLPIQLRDSQSPFCSMYSDNFYNFQTNGSARFIQMERDGPRKFAHWRALLRNAQSSPALIERVDLQPCLRGIH
jgi:hypothetical protein